MTQGWWHRASTEQRLAQIDGCIAVGMTGVQSLSRRRTSRFLGGEMNIVSFRQAPRIETPIVVVRIQFQSLSHPLPATGWLPRRLTRFLALVSGAFYPGRGRSRDLNLFGPFQAARRLFHAALTVCQDARQHSAKNFKAFLPHGDNHEGKALKCPTRSMKGLTK